jgi:GWxTD domain-containing protein
MVVLMSKKNIYLLMLLSVLVFATSYIPEQADSSKADVGGLHPEFSVFNVNDSISELHFKINSKELLYMRPDGIDFLSNVLVSCQLVATYDSKQVLDSSSARIVDLNNQQVTKDLIGKISVRTAMAHTYYLKVKVADLNRNVDITKIIAIDKTSDHNRQNFLVKSKTADVPLFRNYVKPGEQVCIYCKFKKATKLFVKYYNRPFSLALPPFSTVESKPLQYKADSVFTLSINTSGAFDFVVDKKGFYHFQLDTLKKEGLTLFNFSETFPEIKRAEDLVTPLRFITAKQEYDEMINANNQKAAVESFWTACAGSRERAREMIRKYYNRVEDANMYFTSYLEGWKTDRGMIYLIYGKPNAVYRTANVETWTYGEENNINSISYAFLKVDNPFTDNDYSLERSVVYKQSWAMSVDAWRQGRMSTPD